MRGVFGQKALLAPLVRELSLYEERKGILYAGKRAGGLGQKPSNWSIFCPYRLPNSR